MTSGEAFAKYHAEHAKYGGASWEFHARAQTFCATAATRIGTLEAELAQAHQHISELEKSLENTRKERDEEQVHSQCQVADRERIAREALEQAEKAEHQWDEAVADNAALMLTLQSIVDSIDAHAAPLAGAGVTISFPPLVRSALAKPHPGAALLEEHRKALVRAEHLERQRTHVAGLLGVADGGAYQNDWEAPVRKALVRARNEGLEKAAAWRTSHCYGIGVPECLCDACAEARAIRAMKEPEST